MTDPTPTPDPAPTSDDLVHAIPGLTYRRLDYWVRTNCVDDGQDVMLTAGSGSKRRFTPAEVLRVRHLAHLTIAVGLNLDAAADAAKHANRLHTGEWAHQQMGGAYIVWVLPQSQTADAEHVLEVGLP